MASLFASTKNTRPLPGCGLRFIRSDAPLQLTEEEMRWLQDNDIRTVVDLRSEEETESRPCPLRQREGFVYHHLPVTGGGGTPKSRAHLHQVYLGMLDTQMERIQRTLLEAKTNALFFCTAGKDRTGVAAAVLLKTLGIDEKTIVEDYMLSGENLGEMLEDYAAAHPEAELDIIMPREENILNILRLI